MKCVYHLETEAEEKCSRCGAPLCDICYTDAELNEELCKICRRELRAFRIVRYVQLGSCGLGIAWVIVALFLPFGGLDFWSKLLIGFAGIAAAFVINYIAIFIMTRTLFAGLEPQNKAILNLHRYAVTGMKQYFNQAIKIMNKLPDFERYKDAFYDQLVTILILQHFDLPTDWVDYFSEIFKVEEEELLENILVYGTDVFYENIFNNYNYQAIEPFIEITKRTDRDDLFNKLVDEILTNLENVDLTELTKPSSYSIPGMPQQQQQVQRESPTVLRQKALLTELKLIEEDLKQYLKHVDREEDFQKIKQIIDQYELPAVPKNTFDAVKMIGKQPQQTQQAQQTPTQPQQVSTQSQVPGLIAPPPQSEETTTEQEVHMRTCAECGKKFSKEQLKSYKFEDIKVKVCSDCLTLLKKEGNRKPKQLE